MITSKPLKDSAKILGIIAVALYILAFIGTLYPEYVRIEYYQGMANGCIIGVVFIYFDAKNLEKKLKESEIYGENEHN